MNNNNACRITVTMLDLFIGVLTLDWFKCRETDSGGIMI